MVHQAAIEDRPDRPADVEAGGDDPEDPTDRIRRGNYPNVTVVVSPENLGFSGGNNLGISHARGDYFFLLNNDTFVTPNLLELLLEPFSQNPAVGVTCPKIRFHDQPTIIQYAGYRPLNEYTGQTWAVGLMEPDQGQHDQSGPTFFAHGAAMMVSRTVLERAGTLDDSFFLYYEELDWSARIRRAGFQIYYRAEALIYHRESMSVGKANAMKVYYHTRNRLWFMRRNVEGFPLFVFCVYFSQSHPDLYAALAAGLPQSGEGRSGLESDPRHPTTYIRRAATGYGGLTHP